MSTRSTARARALRELARADRLGVGYTRFSTIEQGSTEEQLLINDGAATDEGVTIVESFKDEGLSRSVSDRPGLRAMFEYIESHPEIGFVVVNELERLTAGIGQRAEIASLCRRLGVSILTEDLGIIDPNDDDKMQQADERAVAAKGEVLKVRRRTRRNLKARVSEKKIAVRPPFGLRMKPLVTADGQELPSGVTMLDARGKKITSGELERHPEEIAWLEQIFAWSDEGMSDTAIANKLTELRVPTKTGLTKWSQPTVAGIVTNPIYKGIYVWGAKRTVRDDAGVVEYVPRELDDPGRVERPTPLGPVVDIELWDRINDKRAARRGERERKRQVWPEQVLDNFVYCGGCGWKMYGALDNAQRYRDGSVKAFRWRYHCTRTNIDAKPGYTMCTKRCSIMAVRIFELLSNAGTEASPLKLTVASGGIRGIDTSAERAKLEGEITRADEAYERVLNMTEAGLLTIEQAKDRQLACNEQKAAAQERLAELDVRARASRKPKPLTTTVANELRQLAAALQDEEKPMELRRELLRDFGIERLYFHDPGLSLDIREGNA